MSTDTSADTVIDEYLARLDRLAGHLPPDRRADLLAEIREHIDGARAAGLTGEAQARTLLERLGTPEEIVAAAADGAEAGFTPTWAPTGLPTGMPVAPPRSLAHEIWAVLFLTIGSFFPVLGWLVGLGLLWTSDRWRTREKVIGTLLVPGGVGGLFYLAGLMVTSCFSSSSSSAGASGQTVVADSCTATPWYADLAQGGAIVALVASLVVPFVLLLIARRRADRERVMPAPAARA